MASTAETEQPSEHLEHGASTGRFRRLSTPLRVLGALAGGFLVYLAAPPRQLWWLAPIGIAVLFLVLYGRRARAGFGYGLLFSFGWTLPLLVWIWDFLGPAGFGPWPWLGVAAVESLLFALPCTIAAVVSRLRLAPLWLAGTMVLGEAIRDRFPVGGFPWGRLAFTQPSGPLLPLASLAGAPLLTFAVALLGACLAALVLLAWRRRGVRTFAWPAALFVLPAVLGLALWPTIGQPTPGEPKIQAIAIQGSGPNIGIGLNSAGDVLWQRTIEQTERTQAAIAAGRLPKPQLAVVGETVIGLSGTDPARLAPARSVAEALDAPTVLGANVVPETGKPSNTALGIDPNKGLTGQYVKQHLVPFGEQVPLRWLAKYVTPFVDRMSDLRAGDQPGVLPAGRARVGTALCFDVAYDDTLRGATKQGANVLAIPTNNAFYGHSEMTYQQEAMARIRAVEHDRAVVVAATTGSSAIIRPDGGVVRQSGVFTPATIAGEVPLRTGLTVADTLGPWPEWVLAAVGLVGLIPAIRARRGKSPQGAPATESS